LRGADVLLVPDGYATIDPDFPEDPYGLGDLGPEGAAAIRSWVEDGGRFVGAVLAAGVGVSSATFENAEEQGISSPDALIRTRVAGDRPLADGVGRFAYAFWDSRYVMHANGADAPGAVSVGRDAGLLRVRLRGRRGGAGRHGGGG
jgi:hypothetical protein